MQQHVTVRAAEVQVVRPMLDYLAGRNDVRLIGPRDAAARAPTLAVELAGPAEAAARALGAMGVNCGGSDFYGVRPLQAMGIDVPKGVLRLSLVHYTSAADVTRAIEALDRVL